MAKEQIKSPSEASIQAAFFDWLALHEKKYPELGLFYAIPNGSHKSPAARGLFKRTGLKAGVPDVHCPAIGGTMKGRVYYGHYYGLWIEFKADKGKVSENQAEWHERLKKAGHRVEVCRGWTEAANVVIDYLNLPLKKFDENGKTGSER